MSSAKLFGFAINVEAEEQSGGGGGSSVAGEISPFNQRESGDCNPYFRFLESNSDSGSASMDAEPDLHNYFIDFFDRESYEVGEFYVSPNQRVSTSGDFNTEEYIELGLGIGIGSGSGSGQLRGDSGGVGVHREIDSGRVEVGTGLTPVGDNLFGEEAMVVDEELEWEDLQNAINWVQEPVQVSLISQEEEEEEENFSLATRDDDQYLDWDLLLDVNNFFVDIMEDSMDLDLAVYLASIDEDGENHGDYNAVLGKMFDNEARIMGSPPASKSVVDDLLVVEITTEELSDGNIVCAICKDEIVVEEKVKRLPCRHYYHGECIILWLRIRNTCPVCRYELPTDDLEYERNRRLQRRGSSGLGRDSMSE